MTPVSDITRRCQAFKDGTGEPWSQLRDWLGKRKYPTPERARARVENPEQDDSVHYSEGTWDEVDRAHNIGLLTTAQFREILALQWETHGPKAS